METKTIIIPLNKIELTITEFKIFFWVLKDKKIDSSSVTLTFERDNSIPNYQKIVELEKSYYKKTLFPAWPIFLTASIALVLFITFTICFFVQRDLVMTVFICTFLLPGILSLLSATICSIIRMKSINAYIKNEENRKRNIIEEVEKLANGK